MVVLSTTAQPYEIDCHDPRDQMEQVYCNNQTLTNQTVTAYIDQTQKALDSSPKLTAKDVYMLSYVLEKIAAVQNMKLGDCGGLYKLYDETLQIPSVYFLEANSYDCSLRILRSVEQFLRNAEHDLEFLNGSSLAVRKRHDPSACSQDGTAKGLADFADFFGALDQQKLPVASIEIPADVVCVNGQTVPFYLVVYRRTRLFIPPADPDEATMSSNVRLGLTEIRQMDRFAQRENNVQEASGGRCWVGMWPEGRPVVSAVVLHNTSGKARVQFSSKDINRPLHGKHEVSWWTGEGWSSTDMCTIIETDEMFVAECPHLTDFTLLVDGSPTDLALCSTSLLILGNFLVMASGMSLLLMALIQHANLSKTVRNRMSGFFAHYPSMRFRVELLTFIYTTTIFLFYLFFGVFSDSRRAFGQSGCSLFAALSYYLLLCCIFLTCFQAWRVLKLVAWSSRMDRVLSLVTHNAVILLTSFAAPLLISLVAYILDDSFYTREDDFCWIRATDVLWAVVVPTSLVALNGAVCLLVAIVRMFPKVGGCSPIRRLMRQDTNTLTRGNRQKARDKLLTILNMQFVLGVPWVLQYLSLFSPRVTVWHWLFTIVNGSQGIVLFVLFLVRRSREPNKIDDDDRNEHDIQQFGSHRKYTADSHSARL
ncbi:Mth-2 [Aphelenchoides fujianensis]|nr:Mth-2 [Aphelenchoides fujianensis]